MENVQGLTCRGKDGPTLQVWSAHQHDFAQAQTHGIVDENGLLDSRRTVRFVDDATRSHQLQLPWHLTQVDHRDGDSAGARDWCQNWDWDSLALTAHPTTGEFKRAADTQWAGRESEFSSPSPQENVEEKWGQREPTLLEFGLNSRIQLGNEDDGLLDLKLGGNGHLGGGREGSPSLKRSRHSPSETQQTRCQVDNCSEDLQNAKDYHRRHKVCEFHAKAPKALVGTFLQRFCQQCSRFHLLKEFDDDRRSCRKRLAGHNRRRRKSQPDAAAALACLLADQSVLSRIINPSGQQQGRDDLEKLLQEQSLVQSLLNARATIGNADIKRAENASQNNLLNAISKSQLLNSLLLSNSSIGCTLPVTPAPVDALISALSTALLSSLPQLQKANAGMGNGGSVPIQETANLQESLMNAGGAQTSFRQNESSRLPSEEQPGHLGIRKSMEQLARLPMASPVYSDKSNSSNEDSVDERLHLDEHQRGPSEGFTRQDRSHQKARNSEAAFVSNSQTAGLTQTREARCLPPDAYLSPEGDQFDTVVGSSDRSSDSGLEKQEQTGSLWFKIFDKNPAEIPSTMRSKILKWLDHRPNDVEGHIKPGCIILTIYVSMPVHAWEKLWRNMEKSLQKLISISDDDFWCTGRVFADFGETSAFIIDGNVYSSKPHCSLQVPSFVLVQPFAAAIGQKVKVTVRGRNLKSPGTRFVCAFQGQCTTIGLDSLFHVREKKCSREEGDSPCNAREKKREREEAVGQTTTCEMAQEQAVTFTVGPFNSVGRGFIEVEGQMWRGAAFPLIVAEKTICQDLSSLERKYIQSRDEHSARGSSNSSEADIIHFLHELGWLLQRLKWKGHHLHSEVPEFSNSRYKWLLQFGVEHSCCSVVRLTLNLLFSTNRSIKQSESRAKDILSEINLLHIAVRNKSKDMVKALVAYSPSVETASRESKQEFVFRPDAIICDGFTALHVSASMQSADSIIDALTDAPKEVWETAWTSAKDAYGQTPLMRAIAGGNDGYVKMVQDKLQRLANENASLKEENAEKPPHLTLNISGAKDKSAPQMWMPSKQIQTQCCKSREARSAYSLPVRIHGLNKGFMQRPFVISMLTVAAVCVCVGVLMRGAPTVNCIRGPFVWERIGFGSI